MSTLEERRKLRHLTTSSGNAGGVTSCGRIAWRDSLASYAFPLVATLALVGFATIALVLIDQFVQLDFIPLLYMLPVVVAATRWGAVPGVVAAIAGAAAADFFFYPPLYTFWLSNPQDVVHLALFLVVAIVISNLAARLKDEANKSRRREKEIRELHTFSQGLATCLTGRDLIFAVQDYLSNTLGYRAILIASSRDAAEEDADIADLPQEIRREALKLIAAGGSRAITVIEPGSIKPWLIRVIMPEILGYGAIAVKLGPHLGEGAAAVARRVEALLEEATATLKHLKAKESIEQATINYQTEILRDALIGGVSHELRTPLASILGSCSVLGEMPGIRNDSPSWELIEGIQDQASHLDDEIRLLLDATRVSAKGILPQKVWTDPTDIIDGAVKQRKRGLTSYRMVFDLMREPPLVYVDPVLIEQALGQLLDNAAKYSPAGTSIKVASRSADGYLELSVTDHGSGMTAEELRNLGTRCFRSPRHAGAASGSGLGLWIASTFVSVNDGTLHAASEGPNLGATISLRLPVTSADTPEFMEASDA